MYGYYWDPTYILVIIGALICMLASANVDASMRKYKRVRNARNMTGAEFVFIAIAAEQFQYLFLCGCLHPQLG